MKAVFFAIALLGAAAVASATVESDFDAFAAKYEKTYETADARLAAMEVFRANQEVVRQLNEAHVQEGGEEVFGITKFMDMTQDDFADFYLGLKVPETLPEGEVFDHTKLRGGPPRTEDWVAKGMTTPIKNQEQCGSCWAFSTTESIESANAMAGNTLEQLTVEQIVDCDTTDSGCNGGDPTTAFQYVEGAGGLESESAYPYTAGGGQAGQCNFDKSKVKQTLTSWAYATQSGNEKDMITASAANGPLSVCVDAQSWQFYTGGIMKAAGCGTQLDHAVQATGWDITDANNAYWTVRNSWGTSWGEQGFIRLQYGANACGITQLTTYAKA